MMHPLTVNVSFEMSSDPMRPGDSYAHLATFSDRVGMDFEIWLDLDNACRAVCYFANQSAKQTGVNRA